MNTYKVTFMVPRVEIIRADDLQAAHNIVTQMVEQSASQPAPKVMSIEKLEETEIVLQ